MLRARQILIGALLVSSPLLVACTENVDSSSTDPDDPRALTVESSADACDISASEAPAGKLAFDVTNTGNEITEFYLLGEDGLRIVGEVENVGPGLTRQLVVAAPAGTYVTACKPGMVGEGIRADFTVTESDEDVTVTADVQEMIDAATQNYAVYVRDQADQLVVKTQEFVDLYKVGDDDAARALYPVARTHWERIETVAESFGDLDPMMDAREADLEPGQKWTGWHRIEKDLWPERAEDYTALTPAQRAKYADDLMANTNTLNERIADLEYTVDQVANGSRGLLEEVALGKITGEEEYWSRTDMWDFQANVDEAKVGYEGVEPILLQKDPELAVTLQTRFDELQALLDEQRVGDGFVFYNELTPEQIKALSDAVNSLSEPLSQLTAGGALLTEPTKQVPDPETGQDRGTPTPTTRGGISRRGLLGGTAVAATVAGGAFVAGREAAASSAEPLPSPLERSYDFRGVHQAGVTTPAQDRLHFASFDIITDSRDDLIAMLKAWTEAAERMTAGGNAGPIGPVEGAYNAPPDDTGEAIGLPPSGLTITFGFGPTMFVDGDGKGRFGLAGRQPAALQPLPHFPGDPVDLPITGGDICIQACADDPQVAVHAVRNLARIGFGTVALRWSQLGFGRTSSTSTTQTTPRNLFGLKDGTMNVKAEETAALDEFVWVQPDDDPNGAWLEGGSYLVVRRINMTIEVWDRQSLGDQEAFIGRTKAEGAPLSGGKEFDQPDFELQGRDGPIMPLDCHVRVVHPDHNGGMRMLRRGYNFVDGNNDLGHMDAGLFFLAFMRDPRTQFIPIQTKMSQTDALVEYLKFNGSALFAVPSGIGQDEYVGQALFG